jgi:alpha/beta hydrolase fold
MTTRDDDVRLADGRLLRRIQDTGATEAPTVVFCHGTPGSRLLHDHWLNAAAAAGLRLLAYDRPGCGGATAQPDRTVADAAADVAALAGQLQLERFAVWGSPAAAPMPWPVRPCWPTGWWRPRSSRRRRPTTLQGWTGSLAWLTGMSSASRWRWPAGTRCNRCWPSRPRRWWGADPAQLIALSGPLLSPPDQAVLDSELAAFQLAVFREAFAAGWRDGSRTTWRWWRPGESTWAGCGCRWWCGMASRTWPCRWPMAAGLPARSLRLSFASCLIMGTSR